MHQNCELNFLTLPRSQNGQFHMHATGSNKRARAPQGDLWLAEAACIGKASKQQRAAAKISSTTTRAPLLIPDSCKLKNSNHEVHQNLNVHVELLSPDLKVRLNCFITEGVCKSEPFRLLFLNTLGLKIEEIKLEHLECETESLPCPKPEATNNDSNQTFTAAEFKAGSWKMTGMEWRHLVGNFAGQEKGEERGNNKISSDPRGMVRRSSVPKWWSNTGVRRQKLTGSCGLEFLEWHSGEGNLCA